MIVDLAAVREMGAEIATTAAALRSTLDDLDERSRLPAEAWTGEARRAFAERRDAWRHAADDLTALLREIGRAPFAIYGLLPAADALTPRSAPMAAASCLLFAVLVTALGALNWTLLLRAAGRGLADPPLGRLEPVSERP